MNITMRKEDIEKLAKMCKEVANDSEAIVNYGYADYNMGIFTYFCELVDMIQDLKEDE